MKHRTREQFKIFGLILAALTFVALFILDLVVHPPHASWLNLLDLIPFAVIAVLWWFFNPFIHDSGESPADRIAAWWNRSQINPWRHR